MVGVTDRTIRQAREVIKNGSQEVNDAVRDGKLSLKKAVEISKLPKEHQAEAITGFKMRA